MQASDSERVHRLAKLFLAGVLMNSLDNGLVKVADPVFIRILASEDVEIAIKVDYSLSKI